MNDYFARVWPPSADSPLAEQEPESGRTPEPRLSDRALRRKLGAALFSIGFSVGTMLALAWPIPWPPRVQEVVMGGALSLLYWSVVFWWLFDAKAQ